VAKRLDDENTLLILALDQEVPVGYSLASDVIEHPFMPEWQRAGYIIQFYVTPAHRRRGIGRLMCDFVVEWLASRGIKTLQLNVEPDNLTGEQFWRSQGFVPHRIRMKRAIPEAV
jgi:ribosomal protein S18 acetylase RimI-like enzyme